MFTGLISAVGTVKRVESTNGVRELEIEAPWAADLELGESVAVDGACLTVARHSDSTFVVQAIPSTLQRTLLGELGAGTRVNLERATRVGDRLGGHIVQGHVDGVGVVRQRFDGEGQVLIDIEVPGEVAAVSIPLGSITVSGVSLTINAIPGADMIQVALVPITLQETTLGALRPGDRVQLEGDLVGKHVRAQLAGRWPSKEVE